MGHFNKKYFFGKIAPTKGGVILLAKLGQKFNSYSDELKREILTKYSLGEGTAHSLSMEYSISENTIDTWICKMRKTSLEEVCTKKKRMGRPKDTEIDYKERYQILKKFLAFHNAQLKRK